jgi:hypothetical protein
VGFPLLIWQLVTALLLLAVCSVGPGLVLVRRFRFSPAETFCASVAVSMVFVGLGSMAIFGFNLRPIGAMHVGLTAICLLLDLVCWRDLWRLWRNGAVWRLVGLLGASVIWLLLVLSLIRHYGGGMWWGDWLEQYQRSNYFLHRMRIDFPFLGRYLVVDRPPLMNLICAHFMAEIPKGTGFAAYQLVAVLLNALPILPCCLFAASASCRPELRGRGVGGRGVGRRGVGAVLLLLLVASPIFVQNVTFVWTKAFAAFFAMLGLWFYLRGWMKGDRARLTIGFVLVTAGCLVHLYVAAWLILLAAHYLLAVWPTRPRRFREAATIFLLCDLLLSTWFGWAAHIFGTDVAFNSDLLNPFPGLHNMDAPSRISGNIIDTFVPYFLRNAPYEQWQQTNRMGVLRDAAFDLYQTNAIFAMGSLGAILLVWAMVSRSATWRCWAPRLKQFWAAFVIGTTLLGLCMVPLPEAWGAAHLAMLPLILLGICVLAAMAPRMSRPWLICLLVGCAVDFVLGIFLQAHLENIGFLAGPTPAILSRSALSNFQLKQSYDLFYVGDATAGAARVIELAMGILFIVLLVRAARACRFTGRH